MFLILRHFNTWNQVKSCTKHGRPDQSQWDLTVALSSRKWMNINHRMETERFKILQIERFPVTHSPMPSFDFAFAAELIPTRVGFFIPVLFIKSFRPFHSFWEEDDLSRRSIQAFQNDTIIISWLFSFRVIQPTVQWHTFKTFMFVFINSCSSQALFCT